MAWYSVNSSNSTNVVKSASLNSNALGAYDMSGNVFESTTDHTGGIAPTPLVMRGGSWGSASADLQIAKRDNSQTVFYIGTDVGFRIVKTK